MAEAYSPAVYTIPPHRAFADALAAGLIAEHGGDPLNLARGLILLPNARAARAVSDAFVRRAGGGLLLPRLVPVGDPELDERVGSLLDPADGQGEVVPAAIEPIERLMILARLVSEARAAAGEPVGSAEAARLAADLARTIDQLLIEEVEPHRLRDAVPAELAEHWQRSLGLFESVVARWPGELAARRRIDLADRRNRLLRRVAEGWAKAPPPGFVVAAGITTTAPAVARLLRTVSRLARGMVVLPGLDAAMPADEWDALGPHEAEEGEPAPRSIETHPQFQLKLLLERMGVNRGEVRRWRWGGGTVAPAARTRAIANAMAPAAFTAKWRDLKPAARRLTGVRAAEFANPAEEAQAIALAMREAVETPGRTAALVTPDRALARRVVAHLRRWGIAADDSAGRPLSATAAGTLLIGLAEAAAQRFAPVPLLATLKHPLVRGGDDRLDWLEGVRKLDRALRGPRPPAGLDGVARYLEGGTERERPIRAGAQRWWRAAAASLAPLDGAAARSAPGCGTLVATLREVATALCGDTLWAGPEGRAAAALIEALEAAAPLGPADVTAEDLPLLLRQLMDDVAVRPPQGGHPRLFIWGLIEARLQHADLMILSGLNEGTWPAAPSPDPWLAPAVRAALRLPGLERRIGVNAHDFAGALGAADVLVTRARRDARAPAIASRFWLRLEAMTGGLARAPMLPRWARALDCAEYRPAARPAPSPPVAERPKRIAVTQLDRLKADPFAFYANAMLRLSALDMADADPSPAWRGTAVHAVFEAWMKEHDCDAAALRPLAERMLDAIAAHPVLRALWTPRLLEAIDFTAARVAENRAAGRVPIVAESSGRTELAGVTLHGKVDRIDRLPDGRLAIVDYKTGQPPGRAEVAAGYALQLGLLALIAERGGFDGVEGIAGAFEYWSLARDQKSGQLGYVADAAGLSRGGVGVEVEDFAAHAFRKLEEATARWLTGSEPFVAKLHPEHAPYGDYDQLMRLDEWYGRGNG